VSAPEPGEPMSETDLPVLAALAEVPPPPPDSAGALFLRAAWRSGARAVPQRDAEVWSAWVDLALWERSTVAGPVDLTAHARADLAALAARLGQTAVPEQDPGSRNGLTGEQDARLRTLAALRELGELSPELQELRRSYRERDQRAVVRPPAPVAWPGPTGAGGRS
jgi:hypothetical protein